MGGPGRTTACTYTNNEDRPRHGTNAQAVTDFGAISTTGRYTVRAWTQVVEYICTTAGQPVRSHLDWIRCFEGRLV